MVSEWACVVELKSRKELNGRVGCVIKFHEDQERWEVDLERIIPGEQRIKIAVKPIYVISCPSHFANQTEYLAHRAWTRGGSGDDETPGAKKTGDKAVQALLDKLRAQDESAICQDSATGMTLLPCGHAFHLDWLCVAMDSARKGRMPSQSVAKSSC